MVHQLLFSSRFMALNYFYYRHASIHFSQFYQFLLSISDICFHIILMLVSIILNLRYHGLIILDAVVQVFLKSTEVGILFFR